MSIVDAYNNKKKKEEEEQKIVGQQPKTQPTSNKPTGTTSIPKNNQGVSGRTQEKSTASSLRTESNVTTAKQAPKKEESKQNIVRRNTTTANTQENKQQESRSKATDQRQYSGVNRRNAQSSHGGSSGTFGTDDSKVTRYGLDPRKGQMYSYQTDKNTGSLLDDVNSLPMAPGTGMNQLNNLNDYTNKKADFDFKGKETIGSRQTAKEDLENTLHGRDWKREEAKKDSSTGMSFLSGAGSTALGLAGDLGNLSEMLMPKKSTEGMTPNEIYERAMSNAPTSILNYSGKEMKGDYDAYKNYVLDRMESGDVTPEEMQNMRNLEDAFSKTPAHYLNELGGDARAMNEGFAEGHEISNLAGSLAPLMLENVALGPMADAAGGAASTIANPGVRMAALQGANLIPDVLTDTIPEVMRNVNDEVSADKIISDAAKNLALNEAANLGFEYAPKIIKGIGSKLNGSNVAKRATEEAIPEVAEQAVKNIPDLTGNPYLDVPEINVASNVNKARGNADLGMLRDSIYDNLAKNGGNDEALANLMRAGDVESLSYFDKALKDYDALTGGTQSKQLSRLNDIVNGRIPDGLDAKGYGDILNNIDNIESGLNRIGNLEGLSDLGRTHLNSAYDALNAYEDAVRNGGDADTAAKELNRVLGNLDNQAKKAEGYDGIFSQWKGGGTARGDLFANTNQIKKNIPESLTNISPEEAAEVNDLYDFMPDENRFAKPANQTADTMGANSDTMGTDIPKSDNITPDAGNENSNFGQRRTVTNTGINAEIVTKEQLENDPIIQDIAKYQKHKNELSLAEAMDNVSLRGEEWKNNIISGKQAINSDVAVDTTMLLMRDLDKQIANATDDATKELLTNQKNELLRKLSSNETNFGQMIQALAKWNNTADGAMLTATKVQQNDVIKPWMSKNQKAVQGNSRIAKALAEQGHKPIEKEARVLTHDEIKQGVLAEIEKEFGSVENLFNADDIEFLTQLAENKKIPVWQITDEIEHKLNHGVWYEITEDVQKPKYTNQKLTNALNAMLDSGNVRTEPVQKTLGQIREEVYNTLEKEFSSVDGQFSDSDIDYLANLINNNATKQELTDALNTKMATGSFGISAETQEQVNKLFKEAQQYNPDSKDFVERQAEALRLLAEEVVPDATPLEKFETWRYMAMLGNPKTMLRNYVGNKMFGVVTGVSNNIAAVAENVIDKASKALGGEGIQRTKAVLNPIKDADLIKASALDADANRYRQMVGSKYEKVNKETLKQHRSVWNSKPMRKAEDAIDAGISDYKAIKSKYSTSLAGYLKANGYDKSIFSADAEYNKLKKLSQTQVLTKAQQMELDKVSKQVAELDKARDYALKQAEYATFHEDNAFASWLSKVSNESPGVGHAIIEGVVPFKKTPANVLKSGVEYSPLGAIDSIRKTGKLIYENTGSRAGNLADTYINSKGKEVQKTLANDVIESWSKTLTGTGLLALGYYLTDKGILLSSDEETKYQDQLEGLQNYSIKIGDKTYTIDWAAPAVMPLLLGAEVHKIRNANGETSEDWYKNLDKYLSAANKIADPLVEMSFLQGVQNTIETAANAVQNNDLMSIPAMMGYQAATGYLTQAIPTLGGQIARTMDNTRRSTYTDKEGVAGVLDKQAQKLENKIPFLSETNQPYVDTYGREQRNSPSDNPFFNFAYQTLSPGYLSDVNTTDADRLSREMFEKTGKDSMLPKWQSKAKIDGERVSPEQYTDYAKAYGEANFNIRNELANNEWFNSLSDDEKAQIIGSVNTIAENVGQSAIEEDFVKDSAPYQAYSENGVPGLVDYYKDQQLKNNAKNFDTGNGSLDQKEKLAYINSLENDEEAKKAWDLLRGQSNKELKKNENGEWELEAPPKADSKKETSSKKTETPKTEKKQNSGSFMTGNQTLDARIKAKQKAQEEAKTKSNQIPEAGVDAGSWSVEHNGKTYQLKNTKTYQRAQAAGWSDDDFLTHFHGSDADNSGTITKAEAKAYIDALEGLSKKEKHDMFEILRTRKSKNPY